MPCLGLYTAAKRYVSVRGGTREQMARLPQYLPDKAAEKCPRHPRGGAQRECSFGFSFDFALRGFAPVGSLTRIDMLHRYPSPGSETWIPSESDMATFVCLA